MDFLDRFLEAQQLCPEIIDDIIVWSYSITNVAAGSDAVAIPLRSVFYYVLRDTEVHNRLMEELRQADLSIPVTWSQAQQLPYLKAVINEALRLHPPVGLGLERVVPSSGLKLKKLCLDPGTQVSMCAWVLNRSSAIFGKDPNAFRPGRWLQADKEVIEVYEARISAMGRASLTFGHGSRTCIGKNISFLEMYKLIPTLFLAFDFEIVDKVWETKNSWFVRQAGVKVRLGGRTGARSDY